MPYYPPSYNRPHYHPRPLKNCVLPQWSTPSHRENCNSEIFSAETNQYKWILGHPIHTGAQGRVFSSKGRSSYIIKVERSQAVGSIKREVEVYRKLFQKGRNMKFCTYYSTKNQYYKGERRDAIVLDRHERKMSSYGTRSYWKYSRNIFELGEALVRRLCDVHYVGYVHTDICLENIIYKNGDRRLPILIDFGSATKIGYRAQRSTTNRLFASTTALQGRPLGPKDDLESLWFLIVYLYTGSLPWKKYDSTEMILRKREKTRLTDFGKLPGSFRSIFVLLKRLSIKMFPDYSRIRHLLRKCSEM